MGDTRRLSSAIAEIERQNAVVRVGSASRVVSRFAAMAAVTILLASCGGSPPAFRILAGSEEKTFQPIV
jgi:hypothetical protein